MAEPATVRDLLPEDAYDGDDPFTERLRVVERWADDAANDPNESSRRNRARLALVKLDQLGDEVLAFMDRLSAARAKAQAAD